MEANAFMTVNEAAQELGVSRSRVAQFLLDGALTGEKRLGDRGWSVHRDSVEWLKKIRADIKALRTEMTGGTSDARNSD
jgi:excisionase family DNA binding protein